MNSRYGEETVEDAPQMLEMFYEGKAKKLYATADPDLVISYFKDDATAFNAKKRGTIEEKGVMNNRISELFFTLLEHNGIPTHFVRRLNDREMLCRRLDIIPAETVVRNIVAGSMAKRLGREEGEKLKHPIVEYYYKSDALDDPLIYPEHAVLFGWATEQELDTIHAMALKVNDVLSRFLDERGVRTSSRQNSSRRRDLSRHLPLLGQGHTEKTRQGSLPPRPRRRRGRLSRDPSPGVQLSVRRGGKFRARNARRL
jgi:phosphoribosylaminoimidazole-succinocarboxamide synthase